MFIVGGYPAGEGYNPGTEIVSLSEGRPIPDCLTDLSDPDPPRIWATSAGGAIPEAATPEAGKKSSYVYPLNNCKYWTE